MPDLTERELAVMRAISRYHISASLDDISARLGYRPARSGRLPVRATLRSMMRRHGEYTAGPYGESGKFVGRLPPRDQWDHEKWFLMPDGKAAVANEQLGETLK